MELAEVCDECVWGKTIPDLVLHLYDFLLLQDGGCPIGRHELLDWQWRMLGYMRSVRDKYAVDRAKLKVERDAAEKRARG